VRKSIFILAGALVLLAGCNSGSTANNTPEAPKWKGLPYRLAFDTAPVKPNPAGIALPGIKFTANPEAVETRADIAVQVDVSDVKKAGDIPDMMIMAPTDISGAEGSISADYIDLTDKSLARMLAGYCLKGKVKLNVALVRSSVSPTATDDQINVKRMSDWIPITLDFKNPHPKC
jgi:hypothetical protein